MSEHPHCRNPACRKPLQRRANRPESWAGACGWCQPCHQRWLNYGKPEGGPPPAKTIADRNEAARERMAADRRARVERYGHLTAQGYPPKVAARMVGVTLDTAYRYSGELKRRAQGQMGAAA